MVESKTPSIMQPWNDWKEPQVFQTEIHAVHTGLDSKNNLILSMKNGEGKTEEFGKVTPAALKELSTRINFPSEFISKLSPDLQPLVINDRINSARKQKFSFVVDDSNEVIAASPGWRETTTHKEIAQITHDSLLSSEFVDSVEVDLIERNAGSLNLRFLTPIEAQITPAVGDILQMGLNLKHSFGTELELSLYTRRLVCTNGMTNSRMEYSWHSDAAKTKGRQIEWLKEKVHEVIDSYDLTIARAARMANTMITGDASAALYQRAKAMHIPNRLIPQILEAFNQEPGNTEWHLINAITRFATHRAQGDMTERLQREAGKMVETYQMATARLPLYMAQLSGVEILSTEDIPALTG